MRSIVFNATFWFVAALFAAEPTGFYSAYGAVDEQHFKAEVSLEQIRKTPLWLPQTTDAPPLSPEHAQAIARRELESVIPSGQTWRLDAVRIVAAAEGSHWLYEVAFSRVYPPDVAVYGGDRFDILVLMDGTPIQPKPIPRPQ
jgi:hypothetical protein